MNLAIVGSGYVGLVTGACFAEVGHRVICVDNDLKKVHQLQDGHIPIYEPGLEELVKKNVAAGRLSFTASIGDAVAASKVIFIAVPTPPQPDGSVDLSFVEGVAREIAVHIKDIPHRRGQKHRPGQDREKVAQTISRCNPGADIDVVSNPEFLREGSAVEDLMKPDRIVVGVSSERAVGADAGNLRAVQRADHVHRPQLRRIDQARGQQLPRPQDFLHQRRRRHLRGLGRQRRAGRRRHGRRQAHRPRLSQRRASATADRASPRTSPPSSASRGNSATSSTCWKRSKKSTRDQKERFLKKIRESLWVLRQKKIGVLGLAFKGNTDDVRSSVAIAVVQQLIAEGAEVRAYDPKAMDKARPWFPRRKWSSSPRKWPKAPTPFSSSPNGTNSSPSPGPR